MTKLIPWRNRPSLPFAESAFDRRLQELFDQDPFASTFRELRAPKADIAETEDEYQISLELPGLKPEEIEVEQIGNHLRVRGERRRESEKHGKRFHRTECTYGAFERTFELPTSVRADAESIHAEFRDGMLEIRVPKLEPQPVAKIPVRAKGAK